MRTRRRLAATVVTGMLLAGSTTVLGSTTLATPAEAHVRPCVSKAEFRSVSRGFSKKRVHRVFDVRGRQSYFFGGTAYSRPQQGREYRACTHWWRGGPHGTVYVDYRKRRGVWRVTSKDAFW
jgi:hypothetical protein